MRKRVVVVGVLVAAVLVAAAALAVHVSAQARVFANPDGWFQDTAGSSIGISVRDATSQELEKAKLNQAGGAFVTSVVDGGPGARAGLRSGDVVTEFDGERVRSARHLTRLVRETAPGRAVKSVVMRDAARRTLDITPEARSVPPQFAQIGPEIERQFRDLPRNFSFDFDPNLLPQAPFGRRARLGAALIPLGDQLASYFGVKQGVLVSSVDSDSSAARAGLKAGDVITAINGRSVDQISDVTEQIREAQAGAALDITVVRDKKETKLKATVPEATRERSSPNRRYREL